MTRGLWDRETVALLLLAAYLPILAVWLWLGGAESLARFAFVATVLVFWNIIFLLARAQPASLALLATALAIAILAPEDLGAFRLFLGISFGAVMGELVFGGWGRNVVHPATVALAFLGFGFPGFPWPDLLVPVYWAVLPAALIGLATGVLSFAVLASAGLVVAAAVWSDIFPSDDLPAACVVLVILVADPVTSASTRLGQWLNGALYGGLLILFAAGWADAAPVQQAVAAALLTSLSAPLLDEAALAIWYAKRRRRHARG